MAYIVSLTSHRPRSFLWSIFSRREKKQHYNNNNKAFARYCLVPHISLLLKNILRIQLTIPFFIHFISVFYHHSMLFIVDVASILIYVVCSIEKFWTEVKRSAYRHLHGSHPVSYYCSFLSSSASSSSSSCQRVLALCPYQLNARIQYKNNIHKMSFLSGKQETSSYEFFE